MADMSVAAQAGLNPADLAADLTAALAQARRDARDDPFRDPMLRVTLWLTRLMDRGETHAGRTAGELVRHLESTRPSRKRANAGRRAMSGSIKSRASASIAGRLADDVAATVAEPFAAPMLRGGGAGALRRGFHRASDLRHGAGRCPRIALAESRFQARHGGPALAAGRSRSVPPGSGHHLAGRVRPGTLSPCAMRATPSTASTPPSSRRRASAGRSAGRSSRRSRSPSPPGSAATRTGAPTSAGGTRCATGWDRSAASSRACWKSCRRFRRPTGARRLVSEALAAVERQLALGATDRHATGPGGARRLSLCPGRSEREAAMPEASGLIAALDERSPADAPEEAEARPGADQGRLRGAWRLDRAAAFPAERLAAPQCAARRHPSRRGAGPAGAAAGLPRRGQ